MRVIVAIKRRLAARGIILDRDENFPKQATSGDIAKVTSSGKNQHTPSSGVFTPASSKQRHLAAPTKRHQLSKMVVAASKVTNHD